MRQHAIAPRRRQKFRAARAFYLVILIVTAIATWSLLTGDGGQEPGEAVHGAVLKRSEVSAVHNPSASLVRRDEEVH